MPIFANLGFVSLNGEVSEWHSPFAVKIGYTIYVMLTSGSFALPCVIIHLSIFTEETKSNHIYYYIGS